MATEITDLIYDTYCSSPRQQNLRDKAFITWITPGLCGACSDQFVVRLVQYQDRNIWADQRVFTCSEGRSWVISIKSQATSNMHSTVVFRRIQDVFLSSDRRVQKKKFDNIQRLIYERWEQAGNSSGQTEGYKDQQGCDEEFLSWVLEELVNERDEFRHLTAENRQREEKVHRPETHPAPTTPTTMSAPAPAPTPTPAPAPTSRPIPGPTSPPFAPIPTPVFVPGAQYNTSELPDVQDTQFVQKIYPTDDELWFFFLFLFIMTQLFCLSFADFVIWSSGSVWGVWRLAFGVL